MMEKFSNGTFQLADLDDTWHGARVNGYRLKKYISRLMTIVEDSMLQNEVVVLPILTVEEDFGPALANMFSAC